MKGKIRKYLKDNGYGFIDDEEGGDRFFHKRDFNGEIPPIGSVVEFTPEVGPKGLLAKAIKTIHREELPPSPATVKSVAIGTKVTDPPENQSAILRRIADWKLDAKLDDNRLFFETAEVSLLETGSKSFVIGRKGTGKTAISEFIFSDITHDRFSKKLTFKNFPFNELYKLDNGKYRAPNQYITLWKYLIYSSIAQMMQVNQRIDPALRAQLDQIYPDEPVESLARKVSTWTSADFGLNILGYGMKFGAKRDGEDKDSSWINRVEILEKMVVDKIDDSSYFILFDELDEDFMDIGEAERHLAYICLLTSLFKAVQDVKSIFRGSGKKIYPIIFLRDDIYDLMKDPDKTKWGDLRLDLDWNVPKLKQILAYRLSKAINPDGPVLEFQAAWDRVFSNQPVRFGSGQKQKANSFDFITKSTQLRPRDYIHYIKEGASAAIVRRHGQILPRILPNVDKAFSNYLRSEIEDEIQGLLPEVHKILDIFSIIRKHEFHVADFALAYKRHVDQERLPDRGAETVLKALFHFSVIGNQPRQKLVTVFRYLNKEARLNLTENICIHRGLFKALQIL
jgi:cold shock CspA family protein